MKKRQQRQIQRLYTARQRQRRWRQWGRGAFVAAIMATLGWGAYSFTSDVMALGDASPVLAGSTSIEQEYPGLPPAVARSVNSVVALQRQTSQGKGVVASGVILNDHQVLTAGHMADDESDVLSCKGTSVQAPGLLTAAAASSLPASAGSAVHGGGTDLALLTIKADDNFRSLPAAKVASSPPKAGDTVFFINYQPAADGTLRSPLSAEAKDPVILSGIVLGNAEYGLAVATGNGQSYGHGEAELLLRKGASGGAVVNSNGELVGLSVSSQSLQANRSAGYIGVKYGVRLPARQYQISNVQTFDSMLLSRLQTDMTNCGSR